MSKLLRPLLALSLLSVLGVCAHAGTPVLPPSGYGNDSYASQLSYDSFNLSVRKRLESVRIGSVGQTFGARSNSFGAAPLMSSDEAYAMAPSSRTGSVASSRRRQLDCVYYSGFTVWGDMYQTWATQRSRGDSDGYKYRTTGPAIGFDWTNGPLTLGAATTYNWGKMKARDYHHDRKVRTWAAEIYGQYNMDMFYVNATLGYGSNTFRSSRNSWSTTAYDPFSVYGSNSDRYKTNSWNIDAEFGYKFNWSGLSVTPHVGVRYFRDRHGSVNEGNVVGPTGSNYLIHTSTRNQNLWELPIGVDVGYEINAGGAIIIPRARFGWTPELNEKRGRWNGTYTYWNGAQAVTTPYGESAARRSRQGFNAGLGLEAKITKAISAHIDYNCNFRSKAYEHHWNMGVGFTF